MKAGHRYEVCETWQLNQKWESSGSSRHPGITASPSYFGSVLKSRTRKFLAIPTNCNPETRWTSHFRWKGRRQPILQRGRQHDERTSNSLSAKENFSMSSCICHLCVGYVQISALCRCRMLVPSPATITTGLIVTDIQLHFM